jgi:ubiquinone/menaquinone biosynthesis C-methylase UbiE
MRRMALQDSTSVEKNRQFFAENHSYAESVSSLDTYRNIREALDRAVAGITHAVDIGAGGVFNYDTDRIQRIDAIDLCLGEAEAARFPRNVTARQGDALALPCPDGAYDGAIIAFLFHHLVGRTPADLLENVRRSFAETHRVLEPGGRLVVAESCVPRWFYAVEKALFRPAAMFVKASMEHPPTLQLPIDLLLDLVRERFEAVQAEPIPMGRWVLQLGHLWPSALTPARPWIITARKR